MKKQDKEATKGGVDDSYRSSSSIEGGADDSSRLNSRNIESQKQNRPKKVKSIGEVDLSLSDRSLSEMDGGIPNSPTRGSFHRQASIGDTEIPADMMKYLPETRTNFDI